MGDHTPFREANSFFGNLYDLFAGLNVFGVSLIPEWLAYVIAGFLVIFIVINVVVITTTVGTWVERRLIGRNPVQARPQSVGSVRPPDAGCRRPQAAHQGGH